MNHIISFVAVVLTIGKPASAAVVDGASIVPRLPAFVAAPSAGAMASISAAPSLAAPAAFLAAPSAFVSAPALNPALIAPAAAAVPSAAPALAPFAAAFAATGEEKTSVEPIVGAAEPSTVDGAAFDGASAKPAVEAAIPAEHAAIVAKAADYFRQKGIPVAKIQYNEGYEMQGMGMYDPPTWTDASLKVSFADVEAYRRWSSALPKKAAGVRVYVATEQVAASKKIDDDAYAAALEKKAAAYFREKGIPVASLHYHPGIDDWSGDSFRVSFKDVQAYRRWKDAVPKKIDGTPVSVEAGQINELDAIVATEQKAALTARIGAYFAKKGFSVGHIGYSEGYESQGMGMYDPPTWNEGHVTVVFNDAAGLERWQKRWFQRVEGYRVVAVLKGAQP